MENKEKVIRKLVEFCKKAESDATTEERRGTITNTAEEIVKLFAIPVVSQRSELLAIAALDKIAHPIKYLQSEAEKDGAKLDGYMAIQITQDANFYQEIADKALKAIANCG